MDLFVPRDKRDKRKKKLKKRPISEMEAGILAVIESVVSGAGMKLIFIYFFKSHVFPQRMFAIMNSF